MTVCRERCEDICLEYMSDAATQAFNAAILTNLDFGWYTKFSCAFRGRIPATPQRQIVGGALRGSFMLADMENAGTY